MQEQPTGALTLQFLAWIAAAPRSYEDVMEAWRTSCPRMTVWEDAVSDGLVQRQPNGAMRTAKVSLTDRGRMLLARSEQPTAEPGTRKPRRAHTPPG